MNKFKKYLAERLIHWLWHYRKPTMTEDAFHALHTLETMRSFIIRHKLYGDCNMHVSDDLVREYGILSHADIWAILEHFKNQKCQQRVESPPDATIQ